MKVLIAGGSGFIGRELIKILQNTSETIFVYTHRKEINNNLGFNSSIRILKANDCFPEVDAIVNLSGESIASKMLTAKRLQEILNSRLDTIELLADKYRNNFPTLFIQASATGIYTDNCEQDEKGRLSDSVYADICKKIENKANSLSDRFNTAVSICRIGVVIGAGGGIVENLKYLPRLFLIGGKNYIPYLSVEDCAKAITFILHKRITGTVNLCSDHYLCANDVLKHSATLKFPFIPVPKFALKFDKRGSLLLTNQKIIPAALKENGFVFSDF